MTQRVPLDVRNNLYALGIELEHSFPFVVDKNVFVTVHDLEDCSGVLRFGNIRFTERALGSALSLTDQVERKKAREAEKKGRALRMNEPATTLAFSKAVCDWGDGQRVWGESEASLCRLSRAS